MKISFLTQQPTAKPHFKGVREDRNTVSQLKENNDYSLNEPNQRRINKAIDNLAKQRGEENIQFLLNVGENLQYQTNIDNGKKTKNDWKDKLKNATEQSLKHSNPILKSKYEPEIKRVFSPKPLTQEEENITMLKKRIMNRVGDAKEAKDINKNLDYFITSTETPTAQKSYIMKRFDYFMSPKYEINPQLADKKAKVLSEMVNDITVNTPESKVPNIKAINQKTHGMCAAISIARKSVAYEDKPDYVDSILEELNSNDTMQVYDLQNLGTGKKVPVKKAHVDFDYAQQKGYRIVDASTLQWMNIAGMYGAQHENLYDYNPFDKENFDAFHDSFFLKSMADEKLKNKQSYYQALTKAKDEIISAKSSDIKKEINTRNNRQDYSKNIDKLSDLNQDLRDSIKEILPEAKGETVNKVMTDMMNLRKPVTDDIKKNKESIRPYSYIPNEEHSQKMKKVKAYFTDNFADTVNEKALDKNVDAIMDTVTDIKATDSKLSKKGSLPAKIAQARKMYKTEASYRAASMLGFMEEDNQTDLLIKENIPDRETRIVKGFDKVIDRIENKDDKKLLNHFAQAFGTDDKKEITDKLTKVRDSVVVLSTVGLDDCYFRLGLGDRRNIVLNEIDNLKEDVKNGNKAEIKRSATTLHVAPDKHKIIKEYTRLEDNINKNPKDEAALAEAYNKMGAKNQVNTFVDVFNQFVSSMDTESPERAAYLAGFCDANGLGDNPSAEGINDAINAVATQFNTISQSLASAENLLDVRNEDGSTYFTVSAPQILMKRAENRGEIVPAKTMKKLQDRFTKIDYIRSSDEFASRQGKISDQSLYQLSKEESDAIKQIHKNLNGMYKQVNRNLDYQYRDLKEPLHKLANYVGTNAGHYWVGKEGSSGLNSPQQVKIFEQITGKPYRNIENLDEAIKTIKNTPHSGTSGSSVFHNEIGGHAQYVADVRPMPNGKDALFHDNSWGASEHENSWVDSEGLTRTDYSDNRGGELGYITDDRYENGNYVDNILYKKGHVDGDTTESKVYKKMNHTGNASGTDFPLMWDIILPGNNPEHKQIAGSLKDTLFLSDVYLAGELNKKTKNMTQDEIKAAILRNKGAGRSYFKDYDKVMERITTTPFHKGIDSQEEYDALPDNDFVKLTFEKAALRNSYPDANITKDLAHAKTMDDVKKIQRKQRKTAYKNFEYAFGKTDENLTYVGVEHGQEIIDSFKKALKDNGINPTKDQVKNVITNLVAIDKDDYTGEFTGSLKDTINIAVDKAGKRFDKEIPESDNAKAAKKQWLDSYRTILEDNTYFTKDDLKQEGSKAEGIRNWVDRKFNPTTDEEFVQVYRKLQDMPKEEFRKVTLGIKDSELGINKENGYNIMARVKASSSQYDSLLRNTLFSDRYYEDVTPAKTAPHYKYGKTEKKIQSYRYVSRSFDDLYRTTFYTLEPLQYSKIFKQNEDNAYKMYGALPSYPKLNLTDNPTLNGKVDKAINIINQTAESISAQKTAVYDIMLVNKLDKYRKSIPEDRSLTPMERNNLSDMVNKYITTNCTDSDFDDSINEAYKVFDLDENATIKDWNKSLDKVVNTVNALQNISTQEDYENSIKENSKSLNQYINFLTEINIAPKYRRRMKEEMHDMVSIEKKLYDNGLDFNSDSIDVQKKIQNNSINPYSKEQADDFGQLRGMIDTAKQLKNADSVDADKLSKQMNDINDFADGYVENYIKPEKQDYVKANINDWMNKELDNKTSENKAALTVKLDKAQTQFREDFQKYNVLNNVTDMLDEYLMLSAKDAPKDEFNKKAIYKNYLENTLNLAKFVEVQDILMQAENTGNPAQVRDYFKDYDVISNDYIGNMDDDNAIDYMVRSLLLDNNTKTAKMFVEKLGLGDRLMTVEKDVMKANNPKKNVDETAKIFKTTKAFTDIVTDEVDTLKENLATTDNLTKTVNEAKKQLIERTKPYAKNDKRVKEDVKAFVTAMDEGKKMIEENPDLPKESIMDQYLSDAFQQRREVANKELTDKQEYIQASLLVYKFLSGLHLPEGSQGAKIQEKMRQDYMELQVYAAKTIGDATDGMNVEAQRA